MSIAANNPEVTFSKMTIPHLMNCPHSDSGWCLECVKVLHEDNEKHYRDYLALLPMAYAAEEWASGRITATDFACVITDGFNGDAKGLELMSRLGWLEDEQKRLLDEIAYLKAALNRESQSKL